jgi:hypothetical protein
MVHSIHYRQAAGMNQADDAICYNPAMPQRVRCDRCNALIPPHAHYVVRIDVFADPSLPEMSSEDLEEMDFDETFRKLLDQMKHMTAQELEEQVHRRLEFKLCPKCQREYLLNPLGKPRRAADSRN